MAEHCAPLTPRCLERGLPGFSVGFQLSWEPRSHLWALESWGLPPPPSHRRSLLAARKLS